MICCDGAVQMVSWRGTPNGKRAGLWLQPGGLMSRMMALGGW